MITDVTAERALVGSVLTWPVHLDDVDGALGEDSLTDPLVTCVWDAIRALRAAGEFVSPYQVSRWLTEHRGVSSSPWELHVAGLLELESGSAQGWLQRVVDVAARRRLESALETGLRVLRTPGEASAADCAANITDLVARSNLAHSETADEQWWAELEAQALHGDLSQKIPTGLPDLSRLVDGWRPGQLIVFGARPAVGKSICLLQTLTFAAQKGIPTALISYEMTRLEIYQRLVSSQALINITRLINGEVTQAEADALDRDFGYLRDLPLTVCTPRNRSLAGLMALTRRLVAKGVRMVGVDYVQLVEAPRDAQRSRQQEIGCVSRSLKAGAMELDIPIAACAQVNRDGQDRQPTLKDLRESGDLESDPDVIIFLHPPNPTLPHLDLIVAKNRNGATGLEEITRQGQYARLIVRSGQR